MPALRAAHAGPGTTLKSGTGAASAPACPPPAAAVAYAVVAAPASDDTVSGLAGRTASGRPGSCGALGHAARNRIPGLTPSGITQACRLPFGAVYANVSPAA